jgi:ferric-dicitrate binding protein FerR (iron transport regulator)
MKPFVRQSLEEQTRLVSRYVAGDLSRSERAEFEAWLVASPELASEVEMERRLRRGIASAARRGWLSRGASRGSGSARRWQRYSIAAGLVGVLALSLAIFAPGPGSQPGGLTLAGSKTTPTILARVVRLGSIRSLGTAPDIVVASSDAPASLVIEPDVVVLTCEDGAIELECPNGVAPQTPQYAEYELDVVKRRDSTLAWRSPRQAPADRAQLSFTLQDPANLAAGDYDLVVRGHSADHEEVVARFWLRVSAQ